MISGIRACVVRTVSGIDQYVPVEDSTLVAGENIFFGFFRNEQCKDGPSGSHLRTICLPDSLFGCLPLGCFYLGNVAPDRQWQSISGPIPSAANERLFVRKTEAMRVAGIS